MTFTSKAAALQWYAGLGLHALRLHGVSEDGRCTCGSPKCAPRSAGKHPLRPAWQRTPPDLAIAEHENLGLKMGAQPGGFACVALDVDDSAAFSALAATLPPLPQTLTTASGRGCHLLFTVPAAALPLLGNFVKRAGLDLRAEGGQVVAAPSRHYSGRAYELAVAAAPALLPLEWLQWLISQCAQRPADGAPVTGVPPCDDRWLDLARAVTAEAEPDAPGAPGLTWKLAVRLRRGLCLTHETALALLREYNARSPVPFPDDRLIRSVSQAAAASSLPWGFARPMRGNGDLNAAEHPSEVYAGPLAPAALAPSPPPPEPPEFAPRVARVRDITLTDLQELGGRRGCKPALRALADGKAYTDVQEFGAALRVLAYAQPDGVEWSAHSVGALLQRCWVGDAAGFNVADAWGNVLASLREGDLSVLGLMKVFWSSPAWAGCLGYDEMSSAVKWRKDPPITRAAGEDLTDADCVQARAWFQRQFGDDPGKDRTWDAVTSFAQSYATYNPLQEYLSGLRWDGVVRLETWLEHAVGAAPSAFNSLVGAKWLISAVSRALRPGEQCDHVLVLQGGAEGEGKSTAFRTLAVRPEWFTALGNDLAGKEAKEQLQGRWIICFDELAALRRSEREAVKSFVTLTSDDYRPAYGRATVSRKRRGVFCGTVNDETFLQEDPERRWWPVAVQPCDVVWLAFHRDQLWAEAKVRFDRGDDWWKVPAALRAEAQAPFKEVDAIQEQISSWLVRCPEDQRKPFLLTDLAAGLGMGERLDSATQRRLWAALRRMGVTRRQVWNATAKRQEWRWSQ